MFSRFALRKVSALPALSQTAQLVPSATSTTAAYERRKRPIYPGKVRMGFVPDEWYTFFYPKTGVTGPYMFGLGTITYLLSKEIYVMDHEFYTGLSLAIVCVVGVKKLGPPLAEFLDKEIEKDHQEWNDVRESEYKFFENAIEDEKKAQWRSEIDALYIEARKENVKMQLEAEYRSRMASVYNEILKRMNYQVQKNNVERSFDHKHMVSWIVNSVKAALTPELEKSTLQQCIKDLQGLAVKA